ncbi:MAG TPA: methyl-accepting chemotaxis protein, partial [Stenotrophobium sp.]|nr:methyl-accepting chemotaxis protein [Stenotrophobium sp.]
MAESNQASGTRRDFALLAIAAVLIAVAIGGFYYYQSTSSRNETWLTLVRTVNANVDTVVRAGSSAAFGAPPDFRLIAARADDFADTMTALQKGDKDANIPPMPAAVQPQVSAVGAAWNKMHTAVNAVLKGEDPYNLISTDIATINDGADALITTYQMVADQQSRGGSAMHAYLATGQVARLEHIENIARRLLNTGRDAKSIAVELDNTVKAFANTNRELVGDGVVGGSNAAAIKNGLESIVAANTEIVQNAAAVNDMQIAAATLRGQSEDVISAGKTLEQALLDTLKLPKLLPYISLVAAVIALLLIAVFAYLGISDLSRRRREVEERDSRQQKAILGLLDEITNLADGDLTGDVTVTEDFTGAIADSLNYTVGNMRNVVGTINTTSTKISKAANDSQQVSLKMTEDAERQAREITSVTNTITTTSQSLQQVAARAEELAQQALTSVNVAHNGAETVGRTIQGMTALREQIQDTSKRIKRLGESSQEIGNIIELINDIAEQTNTLALNASIQAAMAGDAGRGFAVVADEVQRLAERAATATRQIETLVKTIQADTNEAIISMERSTANVVGGAKSAEEAGQALTKIESSSQELARVIQEISAAARSQSAAATKISGTMLVIRNIAVQTSGSASQTAKAVGDLNVLSEQLRASV